MDIEKLMKVNSLSKELQKHGLSENRDNAVGMAGDIINAPEETEFSRIIAVKAPEEQPEEPEPQGEIKQNPEPQEKRFGKQEVIDILQRFADQFSTEVNTLNQKFQTQSEQLNDLRMQLQNVSEQTVREEKEARPSEDVVAAPSEEKQNNSEQPSAEEKKPDPKSGNFNNEDVAIDKIFYCGTR